MNSEYEVAAKAALERLMAVLKDDQSDLSYNGHGLIGDTPGGLVELMPAIPDQVHAALHEALGTCRPENGAPDQAAIMLFYVFLLGRAFEEVAVMKLLGEGQINPALYRTEMK